MHIHNLARWQHAHNFTADKAENEKKTLRVVLLTGFMMIIEIIAGWLFGSMALLADGWHNVIYRMATVISGESHGQLSRALDCACRLVELDPYAEVVQRQCDTINSSHLNTNEA